MFEFSASSAPAAKCYITLGTLPYNIVDKVPGSKKPFSAVTAHPWCHTVDLVLPQELLEYVWSTIQRYAGTIQYSKVYMRLSELIEGNFFNVYIKSGNIEMTSEGRPGIDPLYSLREGILRLELPKDLYERTGLHGKPIPDGGRKHVPSRYSVEVNLRLPSMVSGRKGFTRLKWAFQNVLTDSMTWLFRDCDENKWQIDRPMPIAAHHPISREALPIRTTRANVLIPPLPPVGWDSASPSVQQEETLDILEWLGMLTLGSPRIKADDDIDPYLSRYAVPNTIPNPEDSAAPITDNIATVRWHGFIPAAWVTKLLGTCLSALQHDDKAWFALSGIAFRTQAVELQDGYTVMMLPNQAKPVADEAPDKPSSSQRHYQQGEGQADDVVQRQFLLWEMVNAVTPR